MVFAFGWFVWLWVAKIFQILFWSMLGLVVNSLSKRALTYKSLFNLGVYALTVSLLFDMLTSVFGFIIPILGWVSLGIYIGYLIWGILAQPVQVKAQPLDGSSTSKDHPA